MTEYLIPSLSAWVSRLDSLREVLVAVKPPPSHPESQSLFVLHDLIAHNNSIWGDLLQTHSARSSVSSVKDVHEIDSYRQWVTDQCESIAGSGFCGSGSLVFEQVWHTLNSDLDDVSLEHSLVEILGLEQLDLISLLLSRRSNHLQGLASSIDTLPCTSPLPRRPHGPFDHEAKSEHHFLVDSLTSSAHTAAYPHVYQTGTSGGSFLNEYGQTYTLPIGSSRLDHLKYEECVVPASSRLLHQFPTPTVLISSLDGLCRATFRGYTSLNRMQSLVFPVAYRTNENMLICAPTGAGKTDVAILTILGLIRQNVFPNPFEDSAAEVFQVFSSNFKIVYVAPMKALAAEVTEKLSGRLSWLGIRVRELTGDTQLSKAEIIGTQIIVTTPEKWDVVTRKSTGDTELVHKVRLLIIDEVHMLHDERGAVLESLVARTQRQVESTQSMIRIVGLSATLPNYVDVADFLKVNKMVGMFYFDSSFRPVPLEQHFLGVKGKSRSKQFYDNLEDVAFMKIMEVLRSDSESQIMVFVHSRKDTVRSARSLLERAQGHELSHLFEVADKPAYQAATGDIHQSRSREIRELVQKGVGVHHAGMSRSDRNLIERLFLKGVIKVLFCTATLAWGVNLPAAAVLIKGTQLYSSEAGKFVDLSILDVIQIFGRAGRPQFQTTGIAYILTAHDKLRHYITTVTQQLPIESNFSKSLRDNLNAEVALGTVTSVSEGVQWLGYSYLFVRMKKNPTAYGIDYTELVNDPQLRQRRRDLIIEAATALQFSQMIVFNPETEELKPKDIGRIASQFYVSNSTIKTFNALMHSDATEADALNLISQSEEFNQIRFRDSESEDLQRLLEIAVPCQIDGGIGTPQSKTNILLQAHISRAKLDDFTLVSDMAYVAQNASRICRALFLIALNRRWGHQCVMLLEMCKSIEKQIWPFQHPFYQFDLPLSVLRQLDAKSPSSSIPSMREMEPGEIGALVHNRKVGQTIFTLLRVFPTVSIEAEVFPLNWDVFRLHLQVIPQFRWNEKHHGTSEGFWLWVENSMSGEIYHHEYFLLSKRKLQDDHFFDFTIPISEPPPPQVFVRVISDRWLGAESVSVLPFQHLIRPDTENVHTDLLDLQPLPLSALCNPSLEQLYSSRFTYFNPMQTQLFHTLYHTSTNILLGSPTGSGKTIAAEVAMWAAFRDRPGSKVVYIAPMKALVRERVQDWKTRLAKPLGLRLVELTGDNTPDTRSIQNADIIVTTPEKWDGISRNWRTRAYVQCVSLVVLDEIHLLGGDRGPVLEIIVSRMNYIASAQNTQVRVMGMSTACANALDLARWLRVTTGLFNFRHSIRPVPLEAYIEGFPEQRGFCPLMQSMNRPTFLAIKAYSPSKPVIVFVPSRRQTRLTASDLINYCGLEENPRRFLNMSDDELDLHQARAHDDNLKESLSFGIGIHHAGLVDSDRQLVEELFSLNKIQILIATSTLAWGVNLPVHLVVIKGTQFFDAKTTGYKDMDLTDVLQMMGRAGRPQFDNSGVALILTQESKKEFYKHFLHTGFPVESSLDKALDDHLAAEIAAGTIKTRQDCLDYLVCTFFFQRIQKNPSYYGLELPTSSDCRTEARDQANAHLMKLVLSSLDSLTLSDCVEYHESSGRVFPTPLGRIMSYYYLSHRTIRTVVSRLSNLAEPSFADLLACLCLAAEYDDLPVRHNEDLINAELIKTLPLNLEPLGEHLPLWDPHVKCFLLIQAHFSRVTLPMTDYVGDQFSALDQSVRIVQAIIDILAERNDLFTLKIAISLLQSLKSARWPHEGIFSILPGVKPRKQDANDDEFEGSHPRNGFLVSSRLTPELLTSLSISKDLHSSFLRACNALPIIDLQPTLSCSPDNDGLTLAVSVTRKNSFSASTAAMYAPLFPKPQLEGFFLLIYASPKTLIAFKRLFWPTPTQSTSQPLNSMSTFEAQSITVKFNISHTQSKVHICLVSDGYIGMEWVTSIDVTSPVFED